MFPFIEVARPIIEQAIRQRIMGQQLLQETTQSTLYLSRLLTQFPQRLEILVDRLERSELGVNVGWRSKREWLQSWRRGIDRLALAVIAVGAAIAGVLLLNIASQDVRVLPATVILIWSQGLLVAGTALEIWLVVTSVRQKRD